MKNQFHTRLKKTKCSMKDCSQEIRTNSDSVKQLNDSSGDLEESLTVN